MNSRTIIYHGPLWPGSTSLERAKAFAELEGIRVLQSDNGQRVEKLRSITARVFWRLRFPLDSGRENEVLESIARKHRPEIIFVDNSKVIRRRTLRRLRHIGVARLVYYSPDDLMLKTSLQLRSSFPEWDIVFTTKTFNVKELAEYGVRHPTLVGKAYDPHGDVPMAPADVGAEYEAFDAVFVGTYEEERCRSINQLAEAGIKVLVYGSDKGGWLPRHLRASVELRPSIFGREYRAAWHRGKVALCFLRKLSRDSITQRTMEIAAMGRPMLAEKTLEHDAHFVDGLEYVGFRDDRELVEKTRIVLTDDGMRRSMGLAARERCLRSGYSTRDRARFMIDAILNTK
jgi:spore maturation protein CgeB